MAAYSKEIIDKAKQLWEQGISAPEIAENLGIKRRETLFNWKKKFGWSKPQSTASKIPPSQRSKCIDAWSKVIDVSVEHLEASEFKSAEEIIKALTSATEALTKLFALNSSSDTEEPETPAKDKVLSLLNLK